MDIVVISAYRLVNHIIDIEYLNPNYDQRTNEQISENCKSVLKLHLAHELVHWDTGDTLVYKELQNKFSETNFRFDLSKNGKFKSPIHKDENKRLYADKAVKAKNNNNEPFSKVFEHIGKMCELGIGEFQEIIADKVGYKLAKPCPIKPELHGPKNVIFSLTQRLEIYGPKTTIEIAKEKIDEAYKNNTAIKNLF